MNTRQHPSITVTRQPVCHRWGHLALLSVCMQSRSNGIQWNLWEAGCYHFGEFKNGVSREDDQKKYFTDSNSTNFSRARLLKKQAWSATFGNDGAFWNQHLRYMECQFQKQSFKVSAVQRLQLQAQHVPELDLPPSVTTSWKGQSCLQKNSGRGLWNECERPCTIIKSSNGCWGQGCMGLHLQCWDSCRG